MQKLYDKDDCAPDALSAKGWLKENNIKLEMILCKIEDFGDTYSNLCITSDLRFLKITYSCGIHETIEELLHSEARVFASELQEKNKEIKWNK